MFTRIKTMASRSRGDDGFSLAEVLVAVAILGTLATASLYLTIGGLNSSESQRRSNVAVTLAGSAMESVVARSTAINASTGLSAIYDGRSHAATLEHWDINDDIPGFDRMIPAWDNDADGATLATVPFSETILVNGTDYTVETMIGQCFQPTAGGHCTTEDLGPASVELTRVITVVWWFAGSSCETGTGCSYHASTLIDTTSDVEWVSN